MIKILLVDDNAEKVKCIIEAICEIPLMVKSDIEVVSDRQNAKRLILDQQFDLMILDLSLPERFGDEPEQNGGAQFLHEINISPDFNVPFHIIGLTAYSDLKDKYSDSFTEYLWHLIIYELQYNNWKTQLINHISYLIKSKAELKNPSNLKYEYDIAIVTILDSIELKCVRELPGHWIEEKFPNDDTYYYTGYFLKDGKKLKVVAASTSNYMGMSAAATLSMKLINKYRPKYLVMLGICAGIKDKCNLGDPIIADRIWDYGSGKHVIEQMPTPKESFKPYGNQITLDTALAALFNNAISENYFVQDIQRKWAIKYDISLTAKIGPFASGSAVIANENIVESIKAQHGKLIAFDMESYAVFYAANYCSHPKPKSFIIKSISDFGDSHKNQINQDEHQMYAAFTSANFFYEFSLRYLL